MAIYEISRQSFLFCLFCATKIVVDYRPVHLRYFPHTKIDDGCRLTVAAADAADADAILDISFISDAVVEVLLLTLFKSLQTTALESWKSSWSS